MGSQNLDVWGVWSGSPNPAEDIDIVNDFALSGSQSLYVDDSGAMDVMMLTQNIDAGQWYIQFQAYIPAGRGGYFNIQGETENEGAGNGGGGVFNSSDLYFNAGGTNAGVFLDNASGATAEYPEDAWFPVTIVFDLDAATPTWHISINGNTVNDDPQPFAADAILGGIDFYSVSTNNEMYIDDVIFAEGSLGAEDFNADVFSVYPNPVVNTLNINSADAVQNVTVYDVLGKVVMNVNPGVVSPSLDMSSLNAGVYLVNVTINGTSKSVKVIK
ncbi:MAG: T9SS type A sorting domain-containing protein [Bacteroidetes bacterium]|nr:T9SS type A sorting domain-containing protein [Bacteroidota bacterium]